MRDQPKSPDHNLYRHSAYSSRLLRVALLFAFAAIIGTLPVSTSGQSAESLYNDAGKAYDSGDVKRAIELYELAEKLVDIDDALASWRHKHVLTVERIIGNKRGTGGSAGAPYLRSTLDKRVFPELWEVRSVL